ncbi:MAG: efflux RND transporter periplasmic adaptor subunit [Treponema sp.]|nr:efflux RND transporter periplasmic adaptor subunit [Treponema sp.]
MEAKKLIRKKRFILAAVLMATFAIHAIFHVATGRPGRFLGGADEAQAAAVPVFTVRTEDAQIRTLQAHLEVNANIVSGHQVAVMPFASGRIASMQVGLGSTVQIGAVIAHVDPSVPGAQFALSPVQAPVSGMVVSTPLPVGSTVSTGISLMTIAVGGEVELQALIPEREVGQLRTGLTATIRLEAFPGETFAATLTQVSPVLDPVSRTQKITMRFDQDDPRVSPGMFARVTLNTRTHEDVITIPREALVDHRGRTVVFVLNDNGYDAAALPHVEMREVSAGVNVGGELEITGGLEPGEEVVVQGQQFLADGARVRVIGGRT